MKSTGLIYKYYPETAFGGFTRADGTVAFYSRVRALVSSTSIVLDVGCGRGAYGERHTKKKEIRIFRGQAAKVIGIDVDQDASANPYLDDFQLISGPVWPVDSSSIDVCICDYVLEHVSDVDRFFSEIRRVLVPGGIVCIRTPNVCSYFGLAQVFLPRWVRAALILKVQNERREEDIFPVLYRCNTRWQLKAALMRQGLDPVVYGHEAEPSYLAFSKFLYGLAVFHQRLAPEVFKLNLFAFARKE